MEIKDVNNMTLEEAVEAHRILWRGIAEMLSEDLKSGNIKECYNIFNLKNNAIKKYFPSLNAKMISNTCFLCQYNKQQTNRRKEINNCNYCPLTLPDEKYCLNGRYSTLYNYVKYYINEKDLNKVISLVKRIAELPVVNKGGRL